MTRSKLTDADKQTIVNLFQDTGASVASLAERYTVSTSTIRRVLKECLEAEPTSSPEVEPPADLSAPPALELPELPPKPTLPGPIRRRSRQSVSPTAASTSELEPPATAAELTAPEPPAIAPEPETPSDFVASETPGLEDFLEDEIGDALDADLEDDDLEEDDLEDEEDLEEMDLSDAVGQPQIRSETLVHVMPLTEALIPRTCYLVIDRYAELITRPLKDFGDLGQIPPEEILERTLPVFDNHRVARRFSNRLQRVVKVPDGKMLQKTCSQLYAKGITRLLINGQVYSL